MIEKHNWRVSQDASDYRATTHALQRQKERSNPTITWDAVTEVIETCSRENIHAGREPHIVNIRGWVSLQDTLHQLRVTVALEEPPHDILTVVCRCHSDSMADCDPAYRND